MNYSDFKIARRWNLLNRFLQVVLAILLAVSLNYLASRSGLHRRYEVVPAQSRTLSIETRQQLDAIARLAPPVSDNGTAWVTIYLTLSPSVFTDAEARREADLLFARVRNLLDDVQFAAARAGRGNWLRVERTNLFYRAGVFTELQNRHPGIDARTSVLVLTCKDREKERCRVLTAADLYATDSTGRIPLFTGEDMLTSALLGLTNEHPPVLYAITGHREMSLSDTGPDGLSRFEARLRARNIETRLLDLSRVNEIPSDVDMLLLAAPRAALAASEVEKIRRYMRERNGRTLALLNPGDPPGPLGELLSEWGILVPNALIHDTAPGATDPQGNLLMRILATDPPHELTRTTADFRLAFAKARPVRADPFQKEDTLVVHELSRTSPNPPGENLSWGEVDYTARPYSYDPVRDIEGPLSVAAIAERSVGIRMNLPSSGGRFLVIGSGDIASNSRIGIYENDFFLLHAVNWMLDQNQYLGIPPRSMAGFQLGATNADLSRVARWFFLPPLLALLLGLLVFFWRRNT